MWWFWALFVIVGSILAFICCKPGDDSTPSKNTAPTKKEKSIDSMIAELEQKNRANQTKADSKSPKRVPDSPRANLGSTVDYMPVDPSKYVFDMGGHRLIGYNADEGEDVLLIPFGTTIVGNDESQITEGKVWDVVYIPRSVHTIHDVALTFVESVYYEGSAAEFARINIGDYAFQTGFIPNHAKFLTSEEAKYAKVQEVKFSYNQDLQGLYKSLAEGRKNEKLCVDRTRAFINICRSLDKSCAGFDIREEFTPCLPIRMYVKCTFRNADYLLSAHDAMKKGDIRMVRYYYDKIVGLLPLSVQKNDFFLRDFSSFCDFLRGGCNTGTYKDNTFARVGGKEIIIEQYIGSCANIEASRIHKAMERGINNLINIKR